MFEFVGELLNVKPNTIQKSLNERVLPIITGKNITDTNTKNRIVYLNNVKRVLSLLHNSKIDNQIELALRKLNG
jgi:hypothetical protein